MRFRLFGYCFIGTKECNQIGHSNEVVGSWYRNSFLTYYPISAIINCYICKMILKPKVVYLVRLNFLVVYCSTNLKAAYHELKNRVHIEDLQNLKSYAQYTRIMVKESQTKFNGVGGMQYSLIRMPLFTKHTKPIS